MPYRQHNGIIVAPYLRLHLNTILMHYLISTRMRVYHIHCQRVIFQLSDQICHFAISNVTHILLESDAHDKHLALARIFTVVE